MIPTLCHSCGKQLEVPDNFAGKRVRCPHCSQPVDVHGFEELPSVPQYHTPMATAPANVNIRTGPSGLGIASLIIGIVAILFCWVPFIGLLAVPLAVIALLLGIVGSIVSLVGRKSGVGLPAGGVFVSLLAIAIPVTMTGAVASRMSDSIKQANANAAQRSSPISTTASGAGGTDAMAGAQGEVEWTPADQAMQVGDVLIRVASAAVGQVDLHGISDNVGKSKDRQLALTISITNKSTAKKLEYKTWNGADFTIERDFGTVRDKHENSYKRITFGFSSRPVGSIQRSESMYPGKEITDVLIFEEPVDGFEYLDLELPAKNVGGQGMIRFRIPATMVVKL